MSEETVTIVIDDREIEARPGSMLIEAADAAGIRIPRFCYHKKLSVAANCRMCLVEVEKAPKPLPACATPVTKGMKVYTRSPKALAAQRGTMEFLLINHPLDCPICDQGGECELQDVAMGYGGDASQYVEGKRVVRDKDIGPLIATDLTRCILCTRCVRFGEELAGLREFGAVGRGERTEIGTFMQRSVDSELSGNVIDLCPVGALTAKPSRYTYRPWELVQHPLVSPHDCLGSNLFLHTKNGAPVRVVPRDNESINEAWLSDRDRYAYQGIPSSERIRRPMVKREGQWQEVGWEDALGWVNHGLRKFAPDAIGALISPSATLEEMFLAQRYLRGLGVRSIDHRLAQCDFSDDAVLPAYPALAIDVEALDRQQCVLLVGSNVRKDQPIAALRLRKAWLRGARMMAINPRDFEFRFDLSHQAWVDEAGMVEMLAGVAREVLRRGGVKPVAAIAATLDGGRDDDTVSAMAEALLATDEALILLGLSAQMHPAAATLRALASTIAANSAVRFGYLSAGANTAGAWLTGVLPHRSADGSAVTPAGLNANEMLAQPRKAYFLLGVEPEYDAADPGLALDALADAEFVVSLASYTSERMERYADVILPIGSFAETDGAYVNCEGRVQSFAAAAKPVGEARPAWKVLRMLGASAGLAGFEQVSAEQVRAEALALIRDRLAARNVFEPGAQSPSARRAGELTRFSGCAMYRTDPLVRHATALQATHDGQRDVVVMHPEDAARLGVAVASSVRVTQGVRSAVLPLQLDASLAAGCVYLEMGTHGSSHLGRAFGPVTIKQA
ncbi:MAG: NADH-quinone oxidoreductase subunit NuoG [Thiotrichales bacterium]